VDKIEKALLLLVLLTVLAGASSPVGQFDIFWQLASGRYMVQQRELIHQDTFTLAAEAPRTEHCWLHDIIVYAVHRLAGYCGLSLLKGVLVALTAAALLAAARAAGGALPAVLFLSFPLFFLSNWA
jgi:hypothetical protein